MEKIDKNIYNKNKEFFDEYILYINDLKKEYEKTNKKNNIDSFMIERILGKYSNFFPKKPLIGQKINFQEIKRSKNILMVGTSGSGKSTISNVLFNYNVDYKSLYLPYPISEELTGQTKDVVFQTSPATCLKIIDSPGLNDNKNKEIVMNAIYIISLLLLEGLDYIIITLGETRISQEAINVLKVIKGLTTNININNNIIFIKTHCDSDNPKLYMNNNKKESKIYKHIKEVEKEENYNKNNLEILNYFCEKSNKIIECSLANDKEDEDDVSKEKRRIKTRDLIFESIMEDCVSCKIDLGNENFMNLFFQTVRTFFGQISANEFSGYFKAIHEKYKEKFSDSFGYILKELNNLFEEYIKTNAINIINIILKFIKI